MIERAGQPVATVPIEDIGLLIVDNPAVTYTQAVFTALAESGAVAVLCDGAHLPCALVQPAVGHTTQTERHRAQMGAPKRLGQQLWRELVSGKLRLQGLVLAEATGSDWGLHALSERVRPGDSANLEAQGAQRYFARVFGAGFRRDRQGAPPNNLLNYGYMVLRAAVARALAGAGLLTSLGLHHHNRGNPFCLADDMVEPYRPFVDLKVVELLRAGAIPEAIGRAEKAVLLSVFNEVAPVTGGGRSPILLAIQRGAASLAQAFLTGRAGLVLPEGLPVTEPSDDEDADQGA